MPDNRGLPPPNKKRKTKADAADPAIASLLHAERQWRGVADPER